MVQTWGGTVQTCEPLHTRSRFFWGGFSACCLESEFLLFWGDHQKLAAPSSPKNAGTISSYKGPLTPQHTHTHPRSHHRHAIIASSGRSHLPPAAAVLDLERGGNNFLVRIKLYSGSGSGSGERVAPGGNYCPRWQRTSCSPSSWPISASLPWAAPSWRASRALCSMLKP